MNVKNSWIGTGRITKDLEVKVTGSGKHVLNFTIAIDDGTKDNPHTTFIPIEAWENMADVIAKYFEKGDQIIVGCRLVNRKVEDRGETRYKLAPIVDSFEWGAKKTKKENSEPVQNIYRNDIPTSIDNDEYEPW